MAYINVREYR